MDGGVVVFTGRREIEVAFMNWKDGTTPFFVGVLRGRRSAFPPHDERLINIKIVGRVTRIGHVFPPDIPVCRI